MIIENMKTQTFKVFIFFKGKAGHSQGLGLLSASLSSSVASNTGLSGQTSFVQNHVVGP